LDSIQEQIVKLVAQTQHAAQQEDASRLAQLASLKQFLASFEAERVLRRQQSDFIKSLYFPEIRRRWDQVPRADNLTNAWLFDSNKTNFLEWLESGRSIFWITGKVCIPTPPELTRALKSDANQAGSGKSTLMKFASEHPETEKALTRWAHPAKPCSPTFFFWNQGFEMQKSQVGLLQSLIYHILRSHPAIIPHVCPERLNHERWEVDELKSLLRRILSQPESRFPVKFCFFIDGLDEYGGSEEELVRVLAILEDAAYGHVKLCVSTRPREFFDEEYHTRRQAPLDIQYFTREDMKTYVRAELETNSKFRDLQASSRPACDRLLRHIADQAQGVWLWVHLVTLDLVHAVNRSENIQTLERILQQFPPDLEAYFARIIQGIKPSFKEEMAQFFLITVEELQPLPLFAFSLLDRERSDPSYAVSACIRPLGDAEVDDVDGQWKGRMHNRCGDLLIVDDGKHPTFLLHPVDFLHRTVRDFLRDCYYKKLQGELPAGSEFQPLVSLCRMMLFLLKSLAPVELRNSASITQLIQIVDELLYYAHEAEKRDPSPEPAQALVAVLDEMDKTNAHHARGMRNHWTHMRDSPTARGYDEYREGGHCSFLALAVQARLVKYVRAKLRSDPRRIRKAGRPLLDYALRPRRVTPISMPYHSKREDPSIDIDMVRLLLEHGADPNQKVHLNDGRTVWVLFLLSCYEMAQRGEASAPLRAVWSRVSELLVVNGADPGAWIESEDTHRVASFPVMTVPGLLESIFGEDEAQRLQALASDRRAKHQGHRWYSSWWPVWRR